jgi:hypothetical protein
VVAPEAKEVDNYTVSPIPPPPHSTSDNTPTFSTSTSSTSTAAVPVVSANDAVTDTSTVTISDDKPLVLSSDAVTDAATNAATTNAASPITAHCPDTINSSNAIIVTSLPPPTQHDDANMSIDMNSAVTVTTGITATGGKQVSTPSAPQIPTKSPNNSSGVKNTSNSKIGLDKELDPDELVYIGRSSEMNE